MFETPTYYDNGNKLGNQDFVYSLPLTRCKISNKDELTQALEDSAIQIRLQIQNFENSTSNLRFKTILQ